MQLEDAEADASEDELAAERATASTTVKSFERKRPARKPFPEHLPRERIVIAAPQCCSCCGSTKLSKLGEDVTETLKVVPRQWNGPRAASPANNASRLRSRPRRSMSRRASKTDTLGSVESCFA